MYDHQDDGAEDHANSASHEGAGRAATGTHHSLGAAVAEEREFIIPIPSGLATKPRGNRRLWPVPSEWWSFKPVKELLIR